MLFMIKLPCSCLNLFQETWNYSLYLSGHYEHCSDHGSSKNRRYIIVVGTMNIVVTMEVPKIGATSKHADYLY